MKEKNSTLCFPDKEKSCFACCPPIRPAGYEHLPYQNILRRIFLENTNDFFKNSREIIPITGYSCWALGYLDDQYRQIGCLLHPRQNHGTDFRYRIDFGEKCSREICPEAKVFLALEAKARRFWLMLANGLDAFSYSSRKTNPLFKMMGWGLKILNPIALVEHGSPFNKEAFFKKYPFFETKLNPRANAYLLGQFITGENLYVLEEEFFKVSFQRFASKISKHIRGQYLKEVNNTYVHRLEIEPEFKDFLRLSVGIKRIGFDQAHELKETVDRKIEDFKKLNSLYSS